MKKILILSFICALFSLQAVNARTNNQTNTKAVEDTSTYTTITGKLVDEKTEDPVIFASVFQTESNIGTVTNSDGEFVLKVPGDKPTGTVSIAHLGYENKQLNIADLVGKENTIKLKQHAIPLGEVVVRKVDPKEILLKALAKKKENYSIVPEMQTGFYRETIKQNRHYVSVSEAILDIYNSGYRDNFDFDRVRIFKGRKSKDVKRMDTILVKFQGGPRIAMFLDIVKNPGVILDPEIFPYYNYQLNGVVKANNRDNYVISFKQKQKTDFPLYDGKIYIDVESYAVTSVDFSLSDKSLEDAASMLVKKKPGSMNIDVEGGNYMVNYREINGTWVLNYVRSEVDFKVKWDRKLFRTNIRTMFEMAITDRDLQNLEKFPYKLTVKYNDVLADEVEAFEDKDFWGEYNYIKPDESIEVAIEKLNKRLKRD